jgi:sugar lactone lactonase YvrE
MPSMADQNVLLADRVFGESARWRGDRLWFCDWGTQEVIAVDLAGHSEVMALAPGPLPLSIDWLPDGRLLIVSGRQARLLRRERDGSLVTHADLSALATVWNEIVVDGRGRCYVNGASLDPARGEFPPGIIALVAPDGTARPVADSILFGNGMAVTPDDATLIVAESHGQRLTAFDIAADGSLSGRRVWADLGDGVPDGICLDAEGCVWYADVPNQRCVRVREGGEVLATVQHDRGCYSCTLGGPGGRTLFAVAARYRGMQEMPGPGRSGQVITAPAPAPAPQAGHP